MINVSKIQDVLLPSIIVIINVNSTKHAGWLVQVLLMLLLWHLLNVLSKMDVLIKSICQQLGLMFTNVLKIIVLLNQLLVTAHAKKYQLMLNKDVEQLLILKIFLAGHFIWLVKEINKQLMLLNVDKDIDALVMLFLNKQLYSLQ